MRILALCTGLILLLGAPGSAPGQEEVPDSALAGHGASAWGTIPPAGDSVTARPDGRDTPLWEQTLLVPYRIGRAPFQGLAWGTEQLIRLGARSELVHEAVEFFFEPRRVRVLPSVQAGGLSGTGGGLTFRIDPFLWQGSKARGRATATTSDDLRLHFGLLGPVASRGTLELGAGFRRRPNARFFGVGPGSERHRSSLFRSEEAWVGGGLSWDLDEELSLEGDVLFSRAGAFPTDEDDAPPLERVFDDLPTGFGRFSDGLTGGLTLVHQTAEETGRPRAGGFRQLRVSFFRSLDREYSDHWTFRAEAQQFLHLVNENQVLALRGFATWIDPTGASVVPFQRLMTNDAPDLLRGFEDFRFRDRGMAVLSAEYRWPLWVWARPHGAGVDMYLLADVGQVFRSRRDLAVSELSTSLGGGLRLLGTEGFLGRLEVARCDEGWVVRLRGEQIFQFARASLYSGSSRVAGR